MTLKKGLVAFIVAVALIAGVAFGAESHQSNMAAGDPPVGLYH